MKRYSSLFIVALLSSVITFGTFKLFEGDKETIVLKESTPASQVFMPAYKTEAIRNVDFTFAANKTVDAVVHVETITNAKNTGVKPVDPFGGDFFEFFYGQPQQSQPAFASGSGVIISNDGYIVTNNHVINGADDIQVTLSNNESFKAELVGYDRDTDIALLKINESKLPMVRFADSDSVQIGEWTLAVGNPFNLTSTVTAGIVSAKARNIDILRNRNGSNGSNTAIESFIQTDAAVNPGNSGGALVNINGELIGINTAIASRTGSYSGYSFAVPSNLVRKVVRDIKDFGTVQRGYLGVNIRSLDNTLADELKIEIAQGVYIDNVIQASAADLGGLKKNDVITHVNRKKVNTAPELQEQVANYRPGEEVNVTYVRNGKSFTTRLTLKNKFNEVSLIDENDYIPSLLGAEFKVLDPNEAKRYGVQGGLKITDLKEGKIRNYTDIKEGFIITHIDEQPVSDLDDIGTIIERKKGNVMIEGIYPSNKDKSYLYAFKM